MERSDALRSNPITRMLLLAAAVFSLTACASYPLQEEMQSMARVYDQPYDRVYSSAEELLRSDLSCAIKKSDEDDGLIETEWVHRIDTEGRKRWKIKAEVHKAPGGTEVIFYKRSDLQGEVSKSIGKHKKKDTAPSPSGGWRKTHIDLASVDDLYRRLETKLAAGQ